MNRSWFVIVFATMFFLTHVGPAEAGLIIGNGSRNNPNGTGGSNFVSTGGYGQQFRTGDAALGFRSAQVMMRSGDNARNFSGTFYARVYSMAGFATLSPLASSVFTADFTTQGEGKWFDVDFGTGLSLSGGTDYVFAIEKQTSGQVPDVSWEVPTEAPTYVSEFGASAPTSTGGFHWQKNNGSSNYTLTSSATSFGFRIETESVPEPSSYALMGLGMASLLTALRGARKRRLSTSLANVSTGFPSSHPRLACVPKLMSLLNW